MTPHFLRKQTFADMHHLDQNGKELFRCEDCRRDDLPESEVVEVGGKFICRECAKRCPGCKEPLFDGHTSTCASGCGLTFCDACVDSFFELCKGCVEKHNAEHERRQRENCTFCDGAGMKDYVAGSRTRVAKCGVCNGTGKRTAA